MHCQRGEHAHPLPSCEQSQAAVLLRVWVHGAQEWSTKCEALVRAIQLAPELIAVQEEGGQIDEVTELLGQFICTQKKWNVSKPHKRMYAGTYNSPWNALSFRRRVIKLTRLPSSLGSSPEKKVKMLSNIQTHVCWGIRLALQLAAARIEVRQIDKAAELLGQFS